MSSRKRNTDFTSFENLKREVEIPREAESLVRELLYVRLMPYTKVRECIERGKTYVGIFIMSESVKRKVPLKDMQEYLDEELELSMSFMEALMLHMPKDMLDMMRTYQFSPIAISRLADAFGNGIPEEGIRLCIQHGIDEKQIRILLRVLNMEQGVEKAKVMADPELDWYQMKTLEWYYSQGLKKEEIEQMVNPYRNCKKMEEMGEYFLSLHAKEKKEKVTMAQWKPSDMLGGS